MHVLDSLSNEVQGRPDLGRSLMEPLRIRPITIHAVQAKLIDKPRDFIKLLYELWETFNRCYAILGMAVQHPMILPARLESVQTETDFAGFCRILVNMLPSAGRYIGTRRRSLVAHST